jgi:hypothetical protein
MPLIVSLAMLKLARTSIYEDEPRSRITINSFVNNASHRCIKIQLLRRS